MNYFTLLARLLPLVPIVVSGVEALHKYAESATKRDLAVQALTLSANVAGVVAPEHKPKVDALAAAVGGMVDSTAAFFHAIGEFTHAKPQASEQ